MILNRKERTMHKITVAIVYATRYGHTERLAQAAAQALEEQHVQVLLHTTIHAANHLEELDEADAILFGTPTYMGGMASEMRLFCEKTVKRWHSRAWQDKIAGGFTNSANFYGDKTIALLGLMTTAMQLGMIWVGIDDLPAANVPESMDSLYGPTPTAWNRNGASMGVMASSFQVDSSLAPPEGDLQTMRNYALRIAGIARRFAR